MCSCVVFPFDCGWSPSGLVLASASELVLRSIADPRQILSGDRTYVVNPLIVVHHTDSCFDLKHLFP